MTPEQQQEAFELLQAAQQYLCPVPSAAEMTVEEMASCLDLVMAETMESLQLGERIGEFLQRNRPRQNNAVN